jgi:hypothetical protein
VRSQVLPCAEVTGGDGRGAAGPGPARSCGTVHESDHTRVSRLFLPGGAVVCKEPLGFDAARRLRSERVMLERLRGVPGVAQLVEVPGYPGSLVLRDAGSTTLTELTTPLATNDVLIGLAVTLARAVAREAPPGGATPGHQPGQHRALGRWHPHRGGFRPGDLAGRAAPRVHPPHRDRRDAGIPGAGGHRAHRPAGGPAGGPPSPPLCTGLPGCGRPPAHRAPPPSSWRSCQLQVREDALRARRRRAAIVSSETAAASSRARAAGGGACAALDAEGHRAGSCPVGHGDRAVALRHG